MQARRSAALVLLILLLDERARASLSGTSPSPVAGARQGPGAAAQLRQPAGAQLGRWRGGLRLRLRGGVFYDPDEGADNDEDEDEWEDEDGSYYETTEEEGDAFDQQAAGGVFAQRVFELPDGTRVDVGDETIPTRYGEGMTAEQALADSEHIPAVGTFSGGCDRDIAEIMLASARVRWVDGAPPAGEQVPLRLRDVYGLGEYVKLAPEDDAERGRRFEPELDQANDPRSLLKVPPEELPDLFHMPCGEDPNGGDDAQTLATRFGNYYGPAPESFSGYVRTPKGRVFVHSWPEPQFETESPEMLLNVSDENGLPIIASPEALAFFHVSVQPHGPTALHPPHSPHRTPVPPPLRPLAAAPPPPHLNGVLVRRRRRPKILRAAPPYPTTSTERTNPGPSVGHRMSCVVCPATPSRRCANTHARACRKSSCPRRRTRVFTRSLIFGSALIQFHHFNHSSW